MKLVGKTDIGFSRADNQDTYCGGKLGNNIAWAAVCDGMGGAVGGAIASNLAIQAMEKQLTETLVSAQDDEIQAILLNAIAQANNLIYTQAAKNAAAQGMGTTIVAVVVKNGTAHIAHVGDSRVYRLHNNILFRETKDHSMVQELVDSGSITQEEAMHHPQKNMITRVLGIGAEVVADYRAEPINAGDIFLLCSDGITSALEDGTIAEILQTTPFFDTASVLVNKALYENVPDNITAVLIQVETAEGE